MKIISLHLDANIFSQTERMLASSKKSRNSYINEAIDFYNKYQKKRQLAKELEIDSIRARESFMEVLAMLESLNDEIEKI